MANLPEARHSLERKVDSLRVAAGDVVVACTDVPQALQRIWAKAMADVRTTINDAEAAHRRAMRDGR